MGNVPCMALILRFCANLAEYGLPAAGMNVHVLDRDLLHSLPALAIEGVEQHCEGPGELSGLV
jgi:hypothetical protein